MTRGIERRGADPDNRLVLISRSNTSNVSLRLRFYPSLPSQWPLTLPWQGKKEIRAFEFFPSKRKLGSSSSFSFLVPPPLNYRLFTRKKGEKKGGISRFESNFNSFRDERRLAVILGCFWSIFFSKTGNRFFNYRFCSRMRDHRSCSDDWNLNDRSATSIITKERAIDPPTWNIVDLIVSQIHLLNDTYNFLYSWM